jgi:DNA-binding winged helix-turn-helix (wHTH) protein/TolB-like protein
MNNEARQAYEFGPYSLDLAERLLRCNGKAITLTPKAFDTLVVFLENSGRLLEKEELMKKLWPNSFVEEANLSHNISLLRKLFAEYTPGEQYIETIPKHGYRFLAGVAGLHDKEPQTAAGARPSLSDTGKHTRLSQKPVVWVVGLLSVALTCFAFYRWIWIDSKPAGMAKELRLIAVLPLALGGVEEGNEYLGLGMADALITRLSNTGRILVRPTSQVKSYKPGQNAVAAGQALRVDAVVEGSIRKLGNRLRVTLQLVSVKDGALIWADQFDDNFTNLFAIEDAAAEKLVRALAVNLTQDERTLLTKRYTESVEAYQAYVKGRYQLNWASERGLRKSIEYFEEAIQKDPKYALPYTGLVDSYVMLAFYYARSGDLLPKAKLYAEKAVSLDDSLPEAHASLGAVKYFFEWDWEAASRNTEAAERSLALSPLYAVRYPCYLHAKDSLGKSKESISAIQRALSLDPSSLWLNTELACAAYYDRQFDLVIRQAKFVLDLDSNLIKAHYNLGRAYGQNGLYDEASDHLNRARTLSEGAPHILGELGYLSAVSGRQREARKLAEDLVDLGKTRYVNPYHLAVVWVGLGDRDQTFTWLEHAYLERSTWMLWLNAEPKFDNLKSDLRFQALLKRMGFAQ